VNGDTFLSLSELATEFEIAVVAMNRTATRVDRKDPVQRLEDLQTTVQLS
jgi:hypothetical protein